MNVCRQHAGKTRRYPRKVDCDHEAGCIVAIHGTQQSRAIMACAYYLSVNRSETNPRGEAILAIFTHALRTQRMARGFAIGTSQGRARCARVIARLRKRRLHRQARRRRFHRGRGAGIAAARIGRPFVMASSRHLHTLVMGRRLPSRRDGAGVAQSGAAPRARFHATQPRAVATSAGYGPGIRGQDTSIGNANNCHPNNQLYLSVKIP